MHAFSMLSTNHGKMFQSLAPQADNNLVLACSVGPETPTFSTGGDRAVVVQGGTSMSDLLTLMEGSVREWVPVTVPFIAHNRVRRHRDSQGRPA